MTSGKLCVYKGIPPRPHIPMVCSKPTGLLHGQTFIIVNHFICCCFIWYWIEKILCDPSRNDDDDDWLVKSLYYIRVYVFLRLLCHFLVNLESVSYTCLVCVIACPHHNGFHLGPVVSVLSLYTCPHSFATSLN